MGCTDMVVGYYFGLRGASLCKISTTNSYVPAQEQFFAGAIFLRGSLNILLQ
jgi:hypothetical protein